MRNLDFPAKAKTFYASLEQSPTFQGEARLGRSSCREEVHIRGVPKDEARWKCVTWFDSCDGLLLFQDDGDKLVM